MIRLIRKLISIILGIVIVVAVVMMAGYFYIRIKHQIDLFDTVDQLSQLSSPVDEEKLCPEAFTKDDMKDVENIFKLSSDEIIIYDEVNGYQINLNNLTKPMKNIIKLTDKQVGIMADTIIKQKTGGKVEIANKDIPIELKQVDFSNVIDDTADFNVIMKLDITPFKENINEKIYEYLGKYIPDNLYISSTFIVSQKTMPFSYEIEHKSLSINNLSKEETEELFEVINLILKTGTLKELNEELGCSIMDILVGTEEEKGLAYSLKLIGATNYSFIKDDENEYFVIER